MIRASRFIKHVSMLFGTKALIFLLLLLLQIWDRKTGVLVANLTGGHTGKIFCVGFDSKKVFI
jgi:phage-related holin